ncbi:hypothetical protein [Paraburkholderia dinghuensis]|uniref:Uncharacterized protein n=1 Tax=Paraburkholderia dinghuensis TaxID=2305225 RepID=A0A3N6MT43_9BURK|nr:hypothetical protein [Paraburkholderia dinghuensis]RQH05015.1 hypothetical protein D1Y85_16545 [Paraburkholderia dinghuensis]
MIDVGYYSVDVLHVRGLTLEHAHGFGLEAGISKIYRTVADTIAQHLRKPISNLDQLEHCLHTKTPYTVYD